MILLLFKYIFTPELHHKLPEIFSLLRTLRGKETGLQYLEVVVRYLPSALEDDQLSWEKIKEIAEQAISKETGEYVITLEEKVKNEGRLEGEKKGINGLKETIELSITLKFPGDIDTVMAEVNKIDDLDTLIKITKAIKSANDSSEILALLK